MVFSHWVVCEDDGRAAMGHAGLASPVDRPLKFQDCRAEKGAKCCANGDANFAFTDVLQNYRIARSIV